MRRVTSRQRLFSWDQFDAAAADSSDGEDVHNNEGGQQSNTGIDYDYDYDSDDYMSCLSQCRSNIGYIRSFSQLSLKNFSAHAYFDLLDGSTSSSDCDSSDEDKDQDQQRDTNLELDHVTTISTTNIDANVNANIDAATSYGTASAKEQRVNIVSPPNSPRKPATARTNIQTQSHAMMMFQIPALMLNPKKRNSDGMKKSVSFSTLLDAEINVNASNECLKQNFLNDMHQDVQIHCFQFLNLRDIKALSVTCTVLHNLLAYGTEIDCNVSLGVEVEVDSQSMEQSQQQQVHHIMGIRNTLWWNIMQKQWPGLNLVTNAHVNTNASASLGVTSLLPERVNFINHSSSKRMNYPALLSQCSATPSAIAEKFFQERPVRRFSFIGNTTMREEETRIPPLFRIFHMQDRASADANANANANANDADQHLHQQSTLKSNWKQWRVVQFTGEVGSGDQSITADRPFPQPITIRYDAKQKDGIGNGNGNDNGNMSTRWVRDRRSMIAAPMLQIQEVPIRRDSASSTSTNDSYSKKSNFFDRLRGCKKYSNSVGAVILSSSQARSRNVHGSVNANPNPNANEPQPFVSPYISSIARQIDIDLTPRMMAYFEVSILPRDKLQEPRDDAQQVSLANKSSNGHGHGQHRPAPMNPQFVRRHPRVDSACVAVGLSTRGFQASSRMPGWDSFSYGYHGDDGGIFHAQGEMIRVYGPTYNVGDTVGCGVNYHNGGIFYTLNGNFLGYAWVNENIVKAAKSDLYPTVGVDSSDPIACNFGNERPFMFNFAGFVANNGNMPIPMNAQ